MRIARLRLRERSLPNSKWKRGVFPTSCALRSGHIEITIAVTPCAISLRRGRVRGLKHATFQTQRRVLLQDVQPSSLPGVYELRPPGEVTAHISGRIRTGDTDFSDSIMNVIHSGNIQYSSLAIKLHNTRRTTYTAGCLYIGSFSRFLLSRRR